ncbi:MAG: hypothetical protein K2Z25_09035 [Beijerinckiaceae bacterium]|nr:hypothetical protein [Beijerinckiaceae bacterium]
MGQPVKFEGTIVRIERDGFGIVEFSSSVGANTHGLFSTTTSESLPPLKQLRTGLSVTGVAEAGGNDLAKVKILDVVSH